MKEEIKYAIEKFSQAFSRLKEGSSRAADELEKDGAIQRFEFSFELLWKTLKIVMEYEGIDCRTPRSCLQEAFRIGLLTQEEVFLAMLEDRNKTAHIYDQETSEQIFERIKQQYIPALEKLLAKLQNFTAG